MVWLEDTVYGKSMEKSAINLERDKSNHYGPKRHENFWSRISPQPRRKCGKGLSENYWILLYGFVCTLANLCSYRKPSVCCMNRHAFKRWWKLRTARLLWILLTSTASVINRSPKYQFILVGRLSLHTSQGAYIYSPLDGMLVHRRDVSPTLNSPVPIYTPGWREALWE